MINKQTQLFDYFEMKPVRQKYNRTEHGGSKSIGKRKEHRPLDNKKWIHLVLKSDKAKGKFSFLTPKNKIYIHKLLEDKSKKFGIRIGDFANVGSHLHLKVKISSRENFQKFLKVVSGLIASFVTGAKKGKPFGKFWEGLAYTRILKTFAEIQNLWGYIHANRIEAAVSKQAREEFLKEYRLHLHTKKLKAKELNFAPT